jgi:hypothetical protein
MDQKGKTQELIQKKERVLRKIFGPKGNELIGKWVEIA